MSKEMSCHAASRIKRRPSILGGLISTAICFETYRNHRQIEVRILRVYSFRTWAGYLPIISAAQANGQLKLRSPMVIHLDSPVTQLILSITQDHFVQGNLAVEVTK
jgi:hypothetical protein